MPQQYNLFDPLFEGVQFLDFDWRYIYVNDALVKYSTFTREELLGYTVMEKYPGIEQSDLFAAMQRCMRERTEEKIQTEFVYPNGTIAYFEFSMQPVPERIFILSVNTTEYHITKEKLVKVNRLYAFTSAINQSIVQINDQRLLLDKACEIAIAIGQFEKAWIFLLDDLTGKLEMVSQCGKHSGWEKELKSVDADDTLLHGTPTGKVLSTGSHAFCNDIQNDPAMEHWKKELGENGIKATISLPLKKKGKVIGIFGLHSSIANFFDEEEVALLKEAAGDISFALDIFEKARRHKEAEEIIVQKDNHFRSLIENGTEMISLRKIDSTLLYISPALTKVLGYTMDELSRVLNSDYIHPDDLPLVVEQVMLILDTPGGSCWTQQRCRHKNGSWIWCEGTVTNMLHEPGIHALVSNFRDISERKEAEQNLLENEKKYRQLFENNPMPMMVIDAVTFQFLDVNKMAVQSYGYSREEEFLTMTALDIRPEEDKEYFKQLDRSPETMSKNSNRGISNHLKKDGTIIKVEVIANQITFEGIPARFILANDVTKQMEAENKEKENESRFRLIIEQANDGICIIDTSGRIIEVNPAGCLMFGYSRDEFLNLFMYDLLFQEDLKNDPIRLDDLKLGKAVRRERILKSKDGTAIETEINAKMLDNGNIIIFTHDISQRKSAQTKLIRSEARLKEAQAIAHSSSWEIDLVNNIHTWSDELYNIYGIDKNEVQASTELFLSFMHPDDFEAAIQNVRECHETLIASTFNFRFIRKDGATRYGYAERRFEFDADNKPIRFYGIIQDVTKAKEAELKLLQNESRLNQAQATAHLGNWELNFETGIALWSNECCRIYGFSPQDNKHTYDEWISFVHPDDLENVMEIINESQKTLTGNTLNHRIVLKDGTVKHIFSETKFEFDQKGKQIGLFGVAHDVTQSKLAELKLEQQNEELVKTNAELDRFVYSVSHDLRSPLTSVLGLVSFIEEESLEEDTLEHAKMIRTSVNRLDGFIKNILSYSQNNRTELELEQIPVKKTIEDIVESLRSIKEAKGIHFEVSIDQSQPFYSDWQRVNTVLENLISNAIKYHKIDQSDRYIIITGSCDRENLKLTIADNGIGIAPAYHSKIFSMFYRLSGQAQGSGIGLYIVKETLEKLQGSINVESELGVGTSFDIVVKNEYKTPQ